MYAYRRSRMTVEVNCVSKEFCFSSPISRETERNHSDGKGNPLYFDVKKENSCVYFFNFFKKFSARLPEHMMQTVVVAKGKMKKFPQKRARGGFVTVVLAEGKSFAKPPFSHSAERTADERN